MSDLHSSPVGFPAHLGCVKTLSNVSGTPWSPTSSLLHSASCTQVVRVQGFVFTLRVDDHLSLVHISYVTLCFSCVWFSENRTLCFVLNF